MAKLNMVKALTRCGMGYCQGRICGSVVQALVARRLGLTEPLPEEVGQRKINLGNLMDDFADAVSLLGTPLGLPPSPFLNGLPTAISRLFFALADYGLPQLQSGCFPHTHTKVCDPALVVGLLK